MNEKKLNFRLESLRAMLKSQGGLKGKGAPWHRRHRNFEFIDEIRIKTVPRYKTSGLSGDEWRTSVSVELLFKGKVISERGYGNMDYATKLLPAFFAAPMGDEFTPAPDEFGKAEKRLCDQPGCDREAKHWLLFKREYSRCGSFSKPALFTEPDYDPAKDSGHGSYAKFCDQHLRRGDCGLEDSDVNYIPITNSNPDKNDAPGDAKSPSGFGGIVSI